MYSRKFLSQANNTKEGFVNQGYVCETIEIDGFNFQEIVDRIYDIYNQYSQKDTVFSVNITGGTNLMAAAACSTAFFTGAIIYYVLFDPYNPQQSLSQRIVEIPTPKIPDIKHLKEHEKSIIRILRDGNREINSSIAATMGISRQLCGRYIRNLENNGLVLTVIDSDDRRYRQVILTKEGKMVSKWF